jgi:hypothetical protein
MNDRQVRRRSIRGKFFCFLELLWPCDPATRRAATLEVALVVVALRQIEYM